MNKKYILSILLFVLIACRSDIGTQAAQAYPYPVGAGCGV